MNNKNNKEKGKQNFLQINNRNVTLVHFDNFCIKLT